MRRKEFLKSLGAGAAFAITYGCLGGCSKDEAIPFIAPNGNNLPVNTILFSLDLRTEEAANLINEGGYIIKEDIVIAKSLSGIYLAATVICTHESRKEVIFQKNEFLCSAHGARFDQTGNGLNEFGEKGLKIYKTLLEGDELTILT